MLLNNMEENYAVVRYYRHKKKPSVIRYNMTIEKAREFCEEFPTKRSKAKRSLFGEFNSFVGFTHMNNL